ncbi:autotransporter adhesin [Jonquetella sp. BV3C21]|uniref:autotransporter adhesin n=1 Tax=Jonquetella sp. BV3C21 TaxID=1111126 RepID=UPI0003AE6E41|nr:autotransporter adhesin [Jonquetella sp. BV3C21]ERL23730.1 YadA-like C-terminal domain protein [Jonquetella sp. BV3C21]
MSKVLETLLNRGKKRQGAASKAGKGTAGRSAARYGAVLALMVGVALMQPAAYAADPATQDDIAGLQAQIDQLKKAQTHYFSVNGGTQGNNYSNDGAKSVNSIAIGVNAATGPKGNDAIAIGTNASAHYNGGPGPIAIGSDTKAHAQYAIAIGGGAEVSGTGGKGDQGIAIGRDARVDNAPGGVALGCDSYATNQSAIAIGSSAHAEELDTLAIGVGAKSYANSGMSMGSYSMAAGKFSIAQGFNSVANGSLSVALGPMATVYDSTTKLAAAEYKKLSPEEKAFYKYHTEGSNGQPDFYYRADMDNHGGDVTFYVDGTALGTYSTAQEKGTSVGALAMTSSFGSALGYRARALSVNSTAVGAYAITRAEDGVALGSYTLADRAAGVGGYNPGTGETYAGDAAAAALFGKTTEVNALNGKIKEANRAIKEAAVAVTDANKAVAADPQNNAKRQALRAAETNYTKAVSERDNLIKEKGGLVGTWSSTLGAVSVGSLEGSTRRITRQITNVAAGSADTDAVNVAQLKALNGKVDANAVHYFSVNDGGARGSNYNNDGAKSVDSIAIGKSAIASKANGIALGNGASINYDEAVAIGRGTRASGVGSIALGGGAMIASNGYDMTSIAIGRQAYVLNGSGGQEYMLSFDQDNWTVSGGLFRRTYAPKDVSRIAGGIAIGAKAYARTGSIDIGSRVYPNDMAGEKAANLRPANIVNMTTVGTNSYNKGPFASIFGAYSIMTGDFTGAGGLNTLQYGAQNTGSVIVGSLNSSRSKGHGTFSGIANSIVGFANTVDNSNGALVYGAGNKITNSLKSLRKNPGADKMKSVDAAAEAFRDMVASEEGGATLAIGGANTADYTQASQIIGVGNTLTGQEAAVSTNNMIDGYRNTGTNVSHVTIIGSNNTVKDSEDNILLGDNRGINAKSHNIVIGSAEKGSSSPLELKSENSVVLGYKANATADGGVALGSDSVADRAAFATETEAPFSKVKLNSTNTLGAVSVGQKGKLRQITNVGDATEDTDAVNLRQLKAVGANLAGLSEFTFNFSNKKAGTVTNVGTTKLTDGALNIQAIDGLKIAYDRSAKLYTVGLDKDAIAADPTLHGKDGRDGKDGKDGVGIDKAVINGDGHLIITRTDSKEIDAGEVKGKDGTDAKWKALVAKAIGTNGTASGSAQEIGADQQLTFEAGKNVDLKLAADGTAGSKLTIAVSENPTFKSVTTGDVTMNGDGLTVKNGPSVTKKGIDAGGKRITNVADGVDKSDAVNVGQLQRAIAEVGGADNGQIVKRVNELDSRVDNVGAMAAAFAAVPSLDYDEAHPTSLGLGYGAYSGKSAVALGLSHYVNRDLLIKGGMSISGDEKSFHLGAAIRLGSSPKVERTNGRTVRVSTTEMVALRQVSDLKDEVSKMSDGMAQQKKEIEELKKLLLNKK